MTVFIQVRRLSGRRIAYPRYEFLKLSKLSPWKHDTNLKYAMRQFLGPRNYKGEYPLNRYATPATNHTPKYIQPDLERGRSLRDPDTGQILEPKSYIDPQGREQVKFVPVEGSESASNSGNSKFVSSQRWRQPFPQNKFCLTNYWVGSTVKRQVFEDVSVQGNSIQEVSQKYGLKVARVEALVRLHELEARREKRRQGKPLNDVDKMASIMEDMFPLFSPTEGPNTTTRRENLSEIPIPPKAQQSRFLTLAESEPFGPMDAATVLELEPAVKTLERLTTEGEHASSDAGNMKEHNRGKGRRVVYGPVLSGERSQLKVTDVPGHISGFRYGSGNRDNKKDRRIGFDENGRMIYV